MTSSEARLQALRRRWEEDRSSAAFLPLAEEYRRLGRLADAVAVLESGLRAQPNHVSAQVALGRCRLESGDAAGATTTLERVIEQDPAQLVANKLLVEAYLRTGRPWEAGERLQLYAALNDRDPEIERLQGRVDAQLAVGRPAPPAASAPAVATAPAKATAPAAAPPPAAPGEVFRLASWPVPAPDLGRVPPPARGGNGDLGEPFPAIGRAGDRRRYLRGLVAGGIFGLRLREPEPPAVAAPRPAPVAEPVAGSVAEPAAEPVAAPAAEPAAEPAVPRATVTLGELYLRQGYAGEAEEIFRAVLRREPENPAARSGLAAAREEQAPSPEPGITLRKRDLLTRYLARLRAGAPRVP
jgi:tetratricopeptide (TPR) repeat protein